MILLVAVTKNIDPEKFYFQIDYKGVKRTSTSEFLEGWSQGTIFVEVAADAFASAVEDAAIDSAVEESPFFGRGFLVRALIDVLSQCRAQIGRFERERAEQEKLAGEQRSPREILQALHRMGPRQKGVGLSDPELRQRLDQLRELHILPE